jgi:rfaE bifunctional protein nucleotidyltransferase chain/domain
MSAVLTLPELALAARDWRADGAVIVLAAGCFDPLHIGHVQHLEAARKLGNVLVVSVAGDALVKASKELPGGPRRPFMPAPERAGIVAAIWCVDAAVICDDVDAKGIIKVLKPHVYVKGEEYRDKTTKALAREGRLLEALGGRMAYLSGPVVRSSSAILAGV